MRESHPLLQIPSAPALSQLEWVLYAERIDGQAMRNYYEWLGLTYLVTLATNPALSLPCGVDEQGMPFGLQLIAPLRADDRLLGMAAAIEACFSKHPGPGRPVPPEARLIQPTPALQYMVTHPPLFHKDAHASTAARTAV